MRSRLYQVSGRCRARAAARPGVRTVRTDRAGCPTREGRGAATSPSSRPKRVCQPRSSAPPRETSCKPPARMSRAPGRQAGRGRTWTRGPKATRLGRQDTPHLWARRLTPHGILACPRPHPCRSRHPRHGRTRRGERDDGLRFSAYITPAQRRPDHGRPAALGRARRVREWARPHARTSTASAREGVRFERCYTSSPICMPARASVMTGRWPHAHGLWDNGVRLPAPDDRRWPPSWPATATAPASWARGTWTCTTCSNSPDSYVGGWDTPEALASGGQGGLARPLLRLPGRSPDLRPQPPHGPLRHLAAQGASRRRWP